MRCAGPVIGTYTKKAAELIGRPQLAGHKKREYCGFNLDDLINDVPEDGKVYTLKCPRCKNKFTVRRTPPAEPATEE